MPTVLVKRDWELAWNLGWCYYKIHKFDKAENGFKLALRLSPSNSREKAISYWGLGMIFIKYQFYRKAEKYLSRAYQIKGGNYFIRIALATAYLYQGKIELYFKRP